MDGLQATVQPPINIPFWMGVLFFGIGVVSMIRVLVAGRSRAPSEMGTSDGGGVAADAFSSSGGSVSEGPWTARDEWRTDELVANTSVSGFGVFFVVVWNLISWPMTYGVFSGSVEFRGDGTWLVVLFPLVGIVGALVVIWPKLKERKFGVTRLKMETMPGRLGRPINAVFRTQIDDADRPEGGFDVSLTCYRRYVTKTHDGDGDSTKHVMRDVKWRDEKTIRPRVGSDNTLEIPVSFRVPPDQPTSSPRKTEERMVWALKADADVPGIDFSAEFEIPVFEPEGGVPDTPKETSDETNEEVFWAIGDEDAGPVHAASDASAEETASGGDPFREEGAYETYEVGDDMTEPVSDGINMKRTPGGGLQIEFEAERNVMWEAILGLFGLVFGGIGVGLIYTGGGVVGGAIFAGVGGLTLYAALYYATHTSTSTITVQSGQVKIESGLFGTSKPMQFPASQLQDVRVSVSGQSGSDYTYSLSVHPANPDAIPELRKQREGSQKVATFIQGAMGGGEGFKEQIEAQLQNRKNAIIQDHRNTIQLAQTLTNKQEADWIATQILDAAERESHF